MSQAPPPDLGQLRQSVTVLVTSCDWFYDAWVPFFYFFKKEWPDNPFAVRLITNRFRLDDGEVRALPVGEDQGWGGNLIAAYCSSPGCGRCRSRSEAGLQRSATP